MKKIIQSIICICIGITLTSCHVSNGQSEMTAISQTIVRVNGSTSMEKLINGIAELIKEEHPNIVIEPQFTGSSAGIEAVLAGTSDIGNSSRSLKQVEKDQGLVENIVAIDGIVVITDAKNQVMNVTRQQLIDIFKGKITNWKELGGTDLPIVVIGREAGSGTRSAFEELLDIEYQCAYVQEINEAGAVVAKVASIPGAIGYISLDLLNENISAIGIENVMPSVETIGNGSYSLQRPFIMTTKGNINEQKEEIQNIFKFIKSDKGKAFIEQIGLVNPKQ